MDFIQGPGMARPHFAGAFFIHGGMNLQDFHSYKDVLPHAKPAWQISSRPNCWPNGPNTDKGEGTHEQYHFMFGNYFQQKNIIGSFHPSTSWNHGIIFVCLFCWGFGWKIFPWLQGCFPLFVSDLAEAWVSASLDLCVAARQGHPAEKVQLESSRNKMDGSHQPLRKGFIKVTKS